MTSPTRERGFALLPDRGFALLIVLWSVVLLALLATNITASGRTEIRLASNLLAAAAAEAAADAAIFEAAYHLIDPAQPWRADRTPHQLRLQPSPALSADIVVQIEDEAGKINPNTAPPELLRALLRITGADAQTSERVAAAIADWRFPGSNPRQQGARTPQYQAAGLPYAPPGAPFETLDELGSVLGMTPALLQQLRPHLSVFNDRDPSFEAADPTVQSALRAASGQQSDPSRQSAPPRTVTLTAQSVTSDGARFTRRATLRLGTAEKEPLLRILTWQTLTD